MLSFLATLLKRFMPNPEQARLQVYRDFAKKCQENLERSFSQHDELHLKTIQGIEALTAWIDELSSRPEHHILRTATRELHFGVLACAQGQYRQAYMALRMTLELSVAGTCFSTREVELREWEKGSVDIRWSALLDAKDGMFSEKFTKALAPDLVKEASNAKGIAITSYHECSDFVHGAAEKSTTLPDDLAFSEDLLKGWHGQAVAILIPVTLALVIRYRQVAAVIGTPKAKLAINTNLSGISAAITSLGA
jgi:hypothetical protein